MTLAPILSLVIPCYNEAASLPDLISGLVSVFSPHSDEVEVILVNNGSSDSSGMIIKDACRDHRFLREVTVEVNQGYGYGILKGLESARGDYLGWTHADLQTDPADALKPLEAIKVQGTSEQLFCKGRRHGRPLGDVLFTVGMSIFESVFWGRQLWEINAQPTIFPRSFWSSWTEPPHDFSLDLFAYVMARRQGLRVFRFPVYFKTRRHGHSHWNVGWQSKIKFIKRTFSYSWALRQKLKR